MTQNNDQSSNPFIARIQQYDAKLSQYGLDEFDNPFARYSIKDQAERRINNENITEDAERQKVYDEIKAQYREYLAYISANNTTQSATIDKTKNAVEDDDTEFQRGYNACIESMRQQEERRKSKYHEGWQAAWKEANDRDVLNIRAEVEQELEQNDTSSISNLLENNAIQRLREEVKQLDERLRKIERYTEE